ncbi:ECF RNA polymerase sigma-E factor [Fundidesulfovibrio magnetotacticus]|uniref:ECF RNA polymerase sigma-E factor n=1 Tax=Fundidesulfovibrio magnetotacticus TaxID=2730080 RepID=A0A6V8M5Y6_9BACT|nr:RNA polymerase sigma factor [Fundidesulfovibrio magnetotacticus]GFK96015.1 ECF RNA polymerase sigma-E factor [Fundidesulfovibrio magnetotacticus]
MGKALMGDAQAVRRVLDGDTEAFEVLVRTHQEHLFRLLSRHLPRSEVAEAAQEALLDAYQNLAKLREPDRFRSWLSAIAMRRAADFWREHARRSEKGVDFSDPEQSTWIEELMAEDSAQRFEELAGRREAVKLVETLLDGLGPEDRIAVELFYAEEYGVGEIAEMLGWGESKVKVRLHRARKKMARQCETLLGRGVRP